MVILAGFLYFFVYRIAQIDNPCLGPPIYPRCVDDLNVMFQVEIVGAACVILIACGVFLNGRIKGAFHFMSLVALLLVAAYVSILFIYQVHW